MPKPTLKSDRKSLVAGSSVHRPAGSPERCPSERPGWEFEPLETRQLLSMAISGNDFVLWYTSSADVTPAAIRPLVAYQNSATSDTVTDWMFDGTIVLDFNLQTYPDQAHAQTYINKLFGTGNGNNQIHEIDTIVGAVKSDMTDSSHRWKVVLTVPYATDGDTNANIQTLIDHWNTLNPTNLELVGFYWMHEQMNVPAQEAAAAAAATLIHDQDLTFWWIPFYHSPGYNGTTYGFDYVTEQPNYAFNTIDATRFSNVNSDISNYSMQGAELETNPRNGLSEAQNAADYLYYAQHYQWNDKFLTTYFHGLPISGFAVDPVTRATYDDYYRYITPNLALQWHLSDFTDGYGGASDSSSHSNNGTLHGTTQTTGPAGGALSFNGSTDYVSAANDPSLNINGSITLEAWIYPTSTPTQPAAIISKNTYGQRMLLTSNLGVTVQMGPTYSSFQLSTSGSTVTLNAWNHLVYTCDGTTSTIYVNGVQKASSSAGTYGADFSSNTQVRIAAAVDNPGNPGHPYYPFAGRIDEVRIYSRALSSQEITRDFVAGQRQVDLVAALAFDETNYYGSSSSVNTSVFDSTQPIHSGAGHYGTMNGTIPTDGIHENTGLPALGTALAFNGTDNYVSYANRSALNITGQITLEAWICPTSLPTSAAVIIGKNMYGQRIYLTSNGGLKVEMGPTYTSFELATSSHVVTPHAWNHVVYTCNGTDSFIYVNGVQKAAGAAGTYGADFGSTADLRIGATAGPNYLFTGLIDQVRLYGRALSAQEIQAAFAAVQGMALAWKFDAATGADSSGNGNTGTLSNTTATTGIRATQALSFNGSTSSVSASDHSSLDITSRLTLEAWIYPTTAPTSYGTIIGRNESGRRMMLTSHLGLVVQLGTSGASFELSTANSVVSLNTWNHVVYACDGVNSTIYVNGVPVATADATGYGADFSSAAGIKVGQSAGTSYSFTGKIDEVVVYNRCLSMTEVRQRFDGGIANVALTFDQGSGTIIRDSSGNRNHGTFSATAATWSATAIRGDSASFSGGYASVPYHSSLNASGQITLEAWIYPTAAPSSYGTILSRDEYGRRMMVSSNLGVTVQMGPTYTSFQLSTSASAVTLNAWNHVVYTSDGTNSSIYVNGVQKATSAAGTYGADFSSTTALKVGQTAGGYYSFTGIIDEVRVTSTAISAALVASQYQAGKASATWHFDEGSGSTAQDATGNGNGAILTSGTGWTASGSHGNALWLDGSSSHYASVARNANLSITGKVSLEAWIYPTSTPTQPATIISKDTFGQRMLLTSNRGITVQMGPTYNSFQLATSGSVIALNTWSHVVYTCDGTNSYLYVNGVQKATSAAGVFGADFSSMTNLRIGLTTGSYYPFAGGIDEVAVYARALTSSEVTAHYAASYAPLMAGSIAATSAASPSNLTLDSLEPIIATAMAHWAAAGLDRTALAQLAQVRWVITDLPGASLGAAGDGVIYLDRNAAGHGWFIDLTPAVNQEFRRSRRPGQWQAMDRQAVHRIDLLTVVEHELGHIAGLEDLNALNGNVMNATLPTGVRRSSHL